MEKKITVNKKFIVYIVALVVTLCVVIGAVFGVSAYSLESGNTLTAFAVNASANGARDNERVQMIDLFKRYPSDYVIGPIDAASSDVDPETGKYTYKSTNLDINGNPTNNIYGIPADQYLDVESYIYTTGVKDSAEGRTLYGWKPNIRAVLGTGSQKGKLAENGKIMSGASVTEDTGIYATFETGQVFGSTEKYVLIVPSDITKIGTGSAAFVYGDKAYYQDYTSGTSVTTGQAYTDFGCFIYSDAIAHYQEPYFWQPRERLAGIYFPEDSRLTTIDGATYTGSTPTASTAWGGSNRTFKRLSGKGAFERCDSLRFLILPNELTSIGKHAFFYCNGIVDMNIPKKVTTIGAYAFGTCTSIRVLPRPAIGGNIDSAAYNGCSFEDENTIYIMGGAPTLDADGNKVYDNGLSGFIFKKNGSSWEAKGLSGETGEDKNKVFIFPDSADFSATSDRRRAVEYDYIDRDGIKTKNSFPDGGVTSYKVGDNFASGKWCQNIIMPKAVTEIGENAFFKSHVKYLETYATKIGTGAFTEPENKEGDDSGNQWYYFHQPAGNPTYSIPNGAFVTPNNGVTRHIVFESKEMYNSVSTTFTGLTNLAPNGTSQTGVSSRIHWQIPVYANIYSEDVPTYNGEGVTLVEGDLEERFYYDSDYVAKSDLKQGNNVILYTKRLSGYAFNQTKQATGGWSATGEGAKHSNPTLGHMQSTVWYTNTGYTASTTASDLYSSTMTTPVNIYTKNIAANAKIDTKTYEFGTPYDGLGTLADDPGNDSTAGSFAFNASLGLTNDYSSAITAFVYPNGSALNPAATYVKNVRHAGTYDFAIGLDTKWGVWKDDYNAENRKVTVTVERQKFDLTSLDKLPEFKTLDNSSLRGDNTTLYRYNDGWYLTQRNGEEPISSVVVTKSYVYDTGNEMTLSLTGFNGNDEKSAYGYLMSTNSYPARGSGEYYTTYSFSVKYIDGAPGQTDYEFYYGAADDDSRFGDLYDDALGLRLDRKTAASVRVNKRWYIVTETNYFIDAAETTPDETTAPYVPVFLNGNPVYSWAYESNISVKTPRLMYNMNCVGNDTVGTEVVPTIEIAYTPVGGSAVAIKSVDDNKPLSYYINSAMPVGNYTVTVYGGGVRAYFGEDDYKTYQPVSGSYNLTVLPAKFNAAAVAAIDTAIKGTSTATIDDVTVTANSYPNTDRKLHDALALDGINDTLNTARRAAAEASNYWAATANNDYYESAVKLAYNLEGSGNTTYVNYDTTLNMIVSAKEYQLYYSISARNYEMYGGESDATRRDKTFYTVIFTNMKISSLYTQYIADINSPYFKNVVYSGEEEHTLVPNSQYYEPLFNDANYIDVRQKATVTLKLYNTQLSKWTYDYNDVFTVEEAQKYFSLNGDDLVVYFDIVAAQNSWAVVPQMPSWTFNGFDAEVNFITAGLAFAGADVTYALSLNLTDWTDEFTVDANGKVDTATAIMLNALKPGAYYLRSTIGDITYTVGSGASAETVTNVNGMVFITSNASGNPITSITVSKAGNSWTSTPNVMRWTFGDYNPNVNIITAEAAYPALKPTYGENIDNSFEYTVTTTSDGTVTVSKVLPYVVFSIRLSGSSTAIVGLESFTEVTDDIAEILAGLHAGTYVLTTSMGGSDYYNAIAPTSLNFVIDKATNTWTTTPQVVQWTWGEYSAAKNIISAETKFSGADGTEGSTDAPILFSVLQVANGTRVVVDKLENFQIDADGNIIDSDAAAAFEALHAGDYYLRATKQGNNDYTSITGGATTDIPFSVAKATAVWEITPNMTSWQYKSFVNDNFRGGEPKDKYINYDKPITYTIERVDGKDFEFAGQTGAIFEFLFNDDGLLDQSMYEALALLHVGEYKIVAVQDPTNDYAELRSEIEFAVLEATNSWSTAPSVIGWTYGSFSDAYFTAGVPTFDESMENGEAANVKYTLTKTGDANFKKEFTSLSEANLATLNAGSYTLVASYAGTDDYRELTSSNVNFTVSKYINGWNPSPSMRGWSYKNFTSALFTAGVPTKQESVGEVTYVLTGGSLGETGLTLTVTSGALSQNSVTALTDLAVGSYTLTVTYAGTDNYDAIVATVTFEVTKISNTWATRPSLLGWTYGSFSSAYFIAGVPTFKESMENGEAAKVKYTLTKNDDNNFTTVTFTALAEANLATLNAGNYTLKVSYVGTANYEALDAEDTVITFTVSPVSNTWDTQPTITGFVYNQFTAANNFIAGVPHFPLSDKAVYYAIGKSAYVNVTTLDDFNAVAGTHFTITDATSINAITAHLGGLGKGAYYFAVFVPADNNYSYLFYTGSFNVSQTSNYWENATPPDVSGWTYGAFADSLFKSGTPIHGTATYTVRYVVDGNVDETDNGIVKIGDTSLNGLSYSELKALLNSLNAGTYSLQASSGSTEDYAEVKASKQFTVTKANNAWDTAPSISGWKFDKTTKTPGNKGAAKYDNAEITAKYYLTTTDSSGNIVADTSKEFSAIKDAGSYAYVLTVADTTNYNGFTTTLFFTVEKDDNFWVTSPAGTYNWIWGNDITALTNNIVNAEAHNGELSFSIVKTSGDGTYTARTDVSISDLLETLPVGKYTITASVTPDGNHVALTSTEAYVEVLAAQLTVNTEPACAGWTWGVADASKVFTDIAVKPANDSDVVSKAYSLSTDGGESWMENKDADYAYLLEYLRSSDRKVGEYKIRIVVSCANHESVTRTVTFTIGNASFTWGGLQQNVKWDWNGNWTESDGGRDIPNLTAADCKGNAVTLGYTINDMPYADFAAVKAYLQSNDRTAGTYTVKVKAELANHETAEKTFTVTVAVAENEWTQSLNAAYTIEYLAWDNADWNDLPTPAAMFGDVVCKYGATTIADINEWIKTLGASAEPYVLMLTVDASTGRYTALSKKVEITVVGIGSTWGNHYDLLEAVQGATDIAATYNFTYNKTVFGTFGKIKTDVVFPIGKDVGTTTYALYFNDTLIPAYNTLEGIAEYFSLAVRTAGTYKIVADYKPKDDSYAALKYTVTINVAKAEVKWNERLESSYSLTYNSVDVPTPTANKDFATVTVTVKKSGTDAALDMDGMLLAEFVKTLDVGTYTITATIEESDNYYVSGARETTSILSIGAIPNAWKNVTSGGKTITATEWTDGYTWTFTRGDTISVMLPESVIGEITITFGGTPTSIKTLADLNDLLSKDENDNSRAAGRYSLRFAVAATDNYNGLVSNCTVVINKKSNTWTQELESVNASGSIDRATFALPTADVYTMNVGGEDIDLRLFNIVKAGDPTNSSWYTAEQFKQLGILANGTYTITARIGGAAPGTPDDAANLISALNSYNADYAEISCSCTVTLSPAENAWNTKLSDKSWTWGDNVSVTLSAADFGSDQIVYTISGSGINTITVKTSDGNIQTALNNAVKGLRPGQYAIAATIAGTDLYTAPAESNFAILTVSKYVASWDTEKDLSVYSLLHMTWNGASNDLLPALSVKCLNGSKELASGAVIWKIGNYQFDNIISALNERDVRSAAYVVTATYGGDEYNEGLIFTSTVIIDMVQTAWDAATTANNGKEYNWVLGSAIDVEKPVLGTPSWGNEIEYKLLKGAQEVPIGSGWNGLVTALGNCKAGEYTITAHIDGDTNHTALDYSVTVNISAKANGWTIKTGNGNSTAKEIEKTFGDDMSFIKFVPEFGASTLVVTVNGKVTNDVIGYINSNGVREYLIVATVAATDEYSGLVDTVRLNVTKVDNTWNNNLAISNAWTWHDNANNINTGLVLPVAAQGDSALVVVTAKTGEVVLEATVSYIRVDGVRKVNDNDFGALNGKLKALNVVSGGYTITVTVGETDSYKALNEDKAQSADFVINKATNNWATGGEPTVDSWSFGGDTAYPSATPVFGKNNVVFTYAAPSDNDKFEDGKRVAPADNAVWQNAPSYQAGSYWLKAYVAGTANYSELVGYYLFTIKEGKNAWVNMPGVIAWNWNGYDAAVNLFSGSARSNQPAQFSITKADKSDLDVTDFVAHDSGVVINVDTIAVLKKFTLVANDVVVSDGVAKLLNALKPATYTLTVTVDGGESLESITGSTTFTVGKASNGWATGKAPAVSSYTYKNYNATTTFTYGETVYGAKEAVTYKLEGTTYDGTTVSETVTSSETKAAYVKLQEQLVMLDAGNYTLLAWVAASSDGTYSALYSSDSPYTTRTFTVARATNGWKNTQLVTQINKAYSEINAASFDATAFAALYAELLHYNLDADATVNYALLNSDYTSRNTDSLTYAELFGAVKALPAGEYVIRATVAQTNNYLAIAPTDTRLTISTHDNSFTAIPDALTAQWARGNDKKNATVLTDFEVKAAYGTDTVTYTLGTATYDTYAEFKAAVKALDAGPYNVTIAIAATDEYAGLSVVRMLTVNPADNNWKNGWNVGGSLSVADATTRAGLSWGWNSTVTWTRAVPLYGDTVHVEIRQWLTATNEWYTVQYVTVDYSASTGDSAVAVISEALSKLDVGNYEIIVSAPASGNWTAISNNTEFEVTKVANSWVKTPDITTSATDNKWVYGATAILGAESKYGTVRYEYETKAGDKLTSMPTKAGEYVIKFIVDETKNYGGISDLLSVTIEKATNRGFSVALSANGWTWGAYDRETNLFKGTPEITDLENASIKFSVGTGIGDSFKVLSDLSMFELNANGLVERDSKVEAALRKLTGGTSEQNNTTQYTLRIHVGETDNYVGFTFETTFNVVGATNTWTKTPSIVTWAVNNWTSESLPSAAALYGAPAIIITGESDGVVYFKGAYKKVEGSDELELVVELNNLNLAPAGYYEMLTTVGTVTGQYNIPLTATNRFRIDVKGAGEANYWEVIPNIDGWVANIDGLFNLPSGKPIRGLPNFVFYVRNEDGTRGQKVDESLTNLVVKKGDKYEADIYIPLEPGSYILVASSNGNPAAEGKPDALKEEEIYFSIGKRPLSFEEELRISTLLYLGEREDWADPTLKASLDDAEITFVYTNKETGVSSTEMPTEAGIYTVTATISALYCESKSMSVDFTVKLSPNGWTAAPNIKDWSEENKGNLPSGAATVGSDRIVYTYASVKEPNKILKGKPTTEGSYIMYADLIVEGYEPLHAEYRFAIEPAYDRQLVIAAIVLTVIAIMLACAVIYFAIRRYKEN